MLTTAHTFTLDGVQAQRLLGGRACERALRLAPTIANLAGSVSVEESSRRGPASPGTQWSRPAT